MAFNKKTNLIIVFLIQFVLDKITGQISIRVQYIQLCTKKNTHRTTFCVLFLKIANTFSQCVLKANSIGKGLELKNL